MTRILLGVVLALGAALAVLVFMLDGATDRADQAERALATAEWERDQEKEAGRILNEHIRSQTQRLERAEQIRDALLTGDFHGADEMLDPALAAWLRCVRDGDTSDCPDGP